MDTKLFIKEILETNEKLTDLMKEQRKPIESENIPEILITSLILASKMDSYMSMLKTFITDHVKTKEQYEAI